MKKFPLLNKNKGNAFQLPLLNVVGNIIGKAVLHQQRPSRMEVS
jgi:hypothetical protein